MAAIKNCQNNEDGSFSTEKASNSVLTSYVRNLHPTENSLLSDPRKAKPVMYHDDYSLLSPDWSIVRKNINNCGHLNFNLEVIPLKIMRDAIDIKKIIYNKHSDWEHENEYRLLSQNSNQSLHLGAGISSLTFGLKCPESQKRYLLNIISRFYGINVVDVYVMKIIDGKLKKECLSLNEGMPRYRSSSVFTS